MQSAIQFFLQCSLIIVYCSLIVTCIIVIVVLEEVVGCTEGAVRLLGGVTKYEGLVEVCVGGVWGVVCPSGWDVREATVVCKQLGFTGIGESEKPYNGLP